jgi:hypothetical protein
VLYACDLRWWRVYGGEVELACTSELWTCAENVDGTNYIESVDDSGLSLRPGRIHTGGNAGYQAIGLAYLWGAARIVLLGYDMQRGPAGESHHHGDHGNGLPNCPAQNLAEWAQRMTQLGIDLRGQGVEVVNSTRRTAVKCFEQMSLEQALYPGDPPAIVRGKSSALLIPQDLLPREHAAFRAGLTAAGYLEGDKPDVSVIWGTYRGKVTGVELVAENGYLDGPGGPYVALAVGGHNGSGRWPEGSSERFNRLGVAVRRWRDKGGHILVCPSRGLGRPAAMRQPAGWVEHTVDTLRRHTAREIRVRQHPGNWKMLPDHPDASLRAELEGAWACVIWASTAGIRALAMGIPVIRCAPAWICAEAAGNDLAQIENPPMPHQMPVFHRLASAQWTLDEISSGAAIRALLEQGHAE